MGCSEFLNRWTNTTLKFRHRLQCLIKDANVENHLIEKKRISKISRWFKMRIYFKIGHSSVGNTTESDLFKMKHFRSY